MNAVGGSMSGSPSTPNFRYPEEVEGEPHRSLFKLRKLCRNSTPQRSCLYQMRAVAASARISRCQALVLPDQVERCGDGSLWFDVGPGSDETACRFGDGGPNGGSEGRKNTPARLYAHSDIASDS